jgi:hypothetical protein
MICILFTKYTSGLYIERSYAGSVLVCEIREIMCSCSQISQIYTDITLIATSVLCISCKQSTRNKIIRPMRCLSPVPAIVDLELTGYLQVYDLY